MRARGRREMGRAAGLGGLLLLAGALAASPQASRPAPPEATVYEEAIDVRVVNVEVVVTDEDGKPVRGLGPADFRLLVDGREVAVDYFTEVQEGRAAASPAAPDTPAAPAAPVSPAEPVGRSYLVFIDDSFSIASPRDEVLTRLAAAVTGKILWGEAELELRPEGVR